MGAAICVTGLGVISPIGLGVGAYFEALLAGRSGVLGVALDLPGSDTSWVPLAPCEFNTDSMRAPSRLPMDRGTAMALAAAEEAAAQAALKPGCVDPERLGVFWGSGMGGAATFDATSRRVYADHQRIRPTSVVTAMPNAPLAELSLRFGAQGAAMGYACACASASVAIGEALRALREGRLDMAVVGGSEALLSPAVIGAWQAMRVLAPIQGVQAADACRPFAANRSGFALGEGAAALVLEREDHARARGAGWRTQLSGYASNCDASHITQPDPAGQARALRGALRDAGLVAADLGHVNAHGTATVAGDAAEAASLRLVFVGAQPAVTASKAGMGHTLGAGGALELVALLVALERGLAPPTAHVSAADPAFEIDLVCGAARELPQLRHALSSSFAFGGTNAVLVASLAA